MPVDPQSSAAYEYKSLGTYTFQLCATFNADSRATDIYATMTVPAVAPYGTPSKDLNGNWVHTSGHQCFLRTIDPALYPQQPPLTK